MSVLELAPPFTANGRQNEFARAATNPMVDEVLFAGAIRSGKTQAACRIILEAALSHEGQYLIARATYRELEDSTKRAFLYGDVLPPACPPELVAQYRASDNLVLLKNGSEIKFRSLEETNVSKVLGATWSAAFIDQVEELDQGTAGEALFDALCGRLSDPGSLMTMLAVANPGSTMHWLYRRFVDPRTRHPRTAHVHVTLEDNADHLDATYLSRMRRTKETRPHWYRCYVLGEWGSFEGAAYQMFDQGLHVVAPMPVASSWERVEGMDFGRNHPTAWLVAAVDEEGNLIVFDEYYSPGPVRDHAAEITRRRRDGWWAVDQHGSLVSAPCYVDPSIKNRYGISDITGRELSVEIEFSDYGFGFTPGQNDRRAGYGRVAELLDPISERMFPSWHPRSGQPGSPRLFIVGGRCPHLVEQLRNAPVKPDGRDMLEVVDPDWEGEHGHAHAAARYLVMSRPSASEPVVAPAVDKREAYRRLLAGEDPVTVAWPGLDEYAEVT